MHVFILEKAKASGVQSAEELLVAVRKAHEADKGNVFNTVVEKLCHHKICRHLRGNWGMWV